MSNVEQFQKAVTDAGADAVRIERIHKGSKVEERLVIVTPGGLVTREVPLKGELEQDIENAAFTARQIVARAKSFAAEPARKLAMSGPRVAATKKA